MSELPELGLVCMTHSERCRFRTITRSRYLSLEPDARRRALEEVYWANIQRVENAVSFCRQQEIRLYRMPSSLFPMSDTDEGEAVLRGFATLLSAIGRRAERLGIRMLMHPDQFVVLSSDNPEVVRVSRLILEKHALAMDLMGLPANTWSTLIIHGGRGGRADALVEQIARLPDNVRNRLSLENDERAYGAAEILEVCRRAQVPMVFDNLHHLIKEKLPSHDDPDVAKFVKLARKTWPVPAWQLVHLSNGQDHLHDQRHSLLIDAFPPAYQQVPWIEVEAKGKEKAIDRLRERLLVRRAPAT